MFYMIFLILTIHKGLKYYNKRVTEWRTSLITRNNVAGASHKLRGMTSYSYNPCIVKKKLF
uniref:Uncharacterized protein n=1 Tax=Picea glauca TaxID=3330 RepID=A0A124GN64_PICGL|nr:hypothetical protein ABT39_MTgene4835 [Picea glauca]QHR88772.1 hypothetical protein Q903MT_gene2787 [Picea sitchensis]